MHIIGLTGGIASGKSTVAEMLKGLGCVIVDTDVLAHEVCKPGFPAYHDIVKTFGEEFLFPDKTLDRKKLGDFVFRAQEALKKLNAIVHPRVWEAVSAAIEKCSMDDVVVLVVPLLIEANMQSTVNEIWLCACAGEVQIKRLVERDGFTEEEARLRIHAQMPLEGKKKFAHKIIDTGVTLSETQKQVEQFYAGIKNK